MIQAVTFTLQILIGAALSPNPEKAEKAVKNSPLTNLCNRKRKRKFYVLDGEI